MAITTRTISSRKANAQSAMRRADTNRDGKLSAHERQHARALVSGETERAMNEAMAQAQLRGGSVSVSKATSVPG